MTAAIQTQNPAIASFSRKADIANESIVGTPESSVPDLDPAFWAWWGDLN